MIYYRQHRCLTFELDSFRVRTQTGRSREAELARKAHQLRVDFHSLLSGANVGDRVETEKRGIVNADHICTENSGIVN